MTLHLHNWTPMMLMYMCNRTAAADILSCEDWTEIETDNNAMTKRVTIEEGGGSGTRPDPEESAVAATRQAVSIPRIA